MVAAAAGGVAPAWAVVEVVAEAAGTELEMNPEELWQTTLNPENRTLLKIQYSKGSKEKSKEDQKIISILMGDDVAPRKEFITSNALEVANLDI